MKSRKKGRLFGGLILSVLAALGLYACTDKPASEDPKTTGGAKDPSHVGEYLELTDWIGKSLEELGMEAPEAGSYWLETEGSLLGVPVKGSLYIEDREEKKNVVYRICLYPKVKELSFTDCYEKFLNLYGGAAESGMEPYVEANGGAMEWYIFDAGPVSIRIAKGSKRDYFQLEIYENKNPGYTGKLLLTKAKTGKYHGLELTASDYSNGILTVTVKNPSKENVQLDTNSCLFQKLPEEDGYGSKFLVDLRLQPEYGSVILSPGATLELKRDLRIYGKLVSDDYMLQFGGANVYFTLKEA